MSDEQICGEEDASYTHSVIAALARGRGSRVYGERGAEARVQAREVEQPREERDLAKLLAQAEHAGALEEVASAAAWEAELDAAQKDHRFLTGHFFDLPDT